MFMWRVSSQHPGRLVLLGLSAVSLIVDHSQQNPQVQKSDDHEPHQNCDGRRDSKLGSGLGKSATSVSCILLDRRQPHHVL